MKFPIIVLLQIRPYNKLETTCFLRIQRKTRASFFHHRARRKTKLIFFSQHIESLRFCFSFWRFEAQAIFSILFLRVFSFGGQGLTRPLVFRSQLSLGFCCWFENLVVFWRQNFNYFVREFLDFPNKF
jgi:hypothetical protein